MKYLATLSFLFMFFVGTAVAQDKSAAELKNEGNEAYRAKNYKQALELFEKSIAVWGDEEELDAAMVYLAATSARKIKDNEKALKYLEECKKMGYKPDVSTYYIANSYKKMGKNEEMEKVLIAGIEEFSTSKYVGHMKKMLVTYYVKLSNEQYSEGQTILNSRTDANRDQWDAIKAKAEKVFEKATGFANKALQYDATNANAKAILTGIDNFLKS